ncbi:hypothetical protein [Kitasatospora sp. NPDC017646]|uniref:hypothetical protein n=1 Tax=Kitasatospora sp. NPDC017646 TaxID=3364024 RepID=UPI00379EB316
MSDTTQPAVRTGGAGAGPAIEVLGQSTVMDHITGVLGEPDVRDRAQAVVAAYESGLVTARAGTGGQAGPNG